MAERENWLKEAKLQNGVEFTVAQRRIDPLKIAIIYLLATAGIALLAAICFIKPSFPLIIVGIILGLTAAVIALPTVVAFLVGIPMFFFSSAESRFTVTSNSIVLDKKYKSQYPEELRLANISEYYVLPPSGRQSETTLTIEYGMFRKTGLALAKEIDRSRYALAVNHRGKEVILSGLLSDEEANFLYSRFEAAL